ncbi:MAG: tetratricopeptide repeat protein [Kiritimatiellia bacterium]|nr:tetratricopeptide repeat protein [Kiritimatiellia bacterium]MDP6847971.1 tetratricopeptide repeat protein [Kiritimatiellia bacterium]
MQTKCNANGYSTAGLLALFFLVAICALIWGRTAGFGFVWDDDYFIVGNPAIRSFSFLPKYFTDISTMAGRGMGEDFAVFRPCRNISYLFDFSVAGLDPAWWHIHNVLLHLLNSLMVFLVARQLLNRTGASFVAAAVFLVHPVQTEVVAWVKCRDDLLAAFFVLLGIHLWMKWREKPFNPLRLAVHCAVYLLACLSKVQAIVVPFLILALEYWLPRGKGTQEQDDDSAGQAKPLVITTVACMCIVMVVFLVWRHSFIGKTSQIDYIAGSFFATMLTMTRAAVKYLALLVWPQHLVADYSGMESSQSLLDWKVAASVAVILSVAWAVIANRRRLPVATFGLLWFGICLAPMSNIIPMMQYMAERFMYVPVAGFALTAGALFAYLAQRQRKIALITAALVLLAFAARTADRVGAWRDAMTIFEVTVRDTPEGAIRPRRNLLSLMINRGRYEEALPLARELWDTWGRDENVSTRWRAEYARHLGFALLQNDMLAEGVPLIHKAIEIDPKYSTAYVDIGVVTGMGGDHAGALEWFKKAAAADETDPGAHYNVGISLRELGRVAEAETAFRASLEAGPSSPGAHKSLAALLWTQGRIPEAVEVYKAARKLWPADKEISHWLKEGRKALK